VLISECARWGCFDEHINIMGNSCSLRFASVSSLFVWSFFVIIYHENPDSHMQVVGNGSCFLMFWSYEPNFFQKFSLSKCSILVLKHYIIHSLILLWKYVDKNNCDNIQNTQAFMRVLQNTSYPRTPLWKHCSRTWYISYCHGKLLSPALKI
jgi:hypothetical protein